MTIDDQILLFFRRFRQAAGNSSIDAAGALDYINDARQSEAIKTKFYRVDVVATAVGGEPYFVLRDDFTPIEAREWATCNNLPITIKDQAEWARITSGIVFNPAAVYEKWGMLDKDTFYNFPVAQQGDAFIFKGTALPPALAATTGADAALTDAEARLCVLAAVMQALEDTHDQAGPMLITEYKELRELVKKRAKPRGARLHSAPGI
jgi:hypothetical protein